MIPKENLEVIESLEALKDSYTLSLREYRFRSEGLTSDEKIDKGFIEGIIMALDKLIKSRNTTLQAIESERVRLDNMLKKFNPVNFRGIDDRVGYATISGKFYILTEIIKK